MRKRRIRSKVQGTAERPRLSVYRSLTQMRAQVIDERIAQPNERAPEQYVAWGHTGHLKLFRAGP